MKTEAETEKQGSKKWLKRALLGIAAFLGALLLVIMIYTFVLVNKATEVFPGNPVDILTSKELTKDENNRMNFLIFGTSEDDEGHSGALLADSILVVSVGEKDAKVFSIPRDLWIDYGQVCTIGGTTGKINAGYVCGLNTNQKDVDKASNYFTGLVEEVTGLSIPYYVNVSYNTLKELTDMLGGIDVEIYSDDSRGIYDKNQNLRLPAGVNHLDGETALKLARARNSKGGYGLSRSNFDREINQQRIIQAIFEKAKKTMDPVKAMSTLDILKKYLKTNVSISEIRYLADWADKFTGKIESIDTSKVLTTGQIGAASVVIPKAGEGNYTELQELIKSEIEGVEEK